VDVRGRKGADAARLEEYVQRLKARMKMRVACALCGWELEAVDHEALVAQDAHLAEHGINRRAALNAAKKRADHERKPKAPVKPKSKPKRVRKSRQGKFAPAVVELEGRRWVSVTEAARRFGLKPMTVYNKLGSYETRREGRWHYLSETQVDEECVRRAA
jgi:hypothetical protein